MQVVRPVRTVEAEAACASATKYLRCTRVCACISPGGPHAHELPSSNTSCPPCTILMGRGDGQSGSDRGRSSSSVASEAPLPATLMDLIIAAGCCGSLSGSPPARPAAWSRTRIVVVLSCFYPLYKVLARVLCSVQYSTWRYASRWNNLSPKEKYRSSTGPSVIQHDNDPRLPLPRPGFSSDGCDIVHSLLTWINSHPIPRQAQKIIFATQMPAGRR